MMKYFYFEKAEIIRKESILYQLDQENIDLIR